MGLVVLVLIFLYIVAFFLLYFPISSFFCHSSSFVPSHLFRLPHYSFTPSLPLQIRLPSPPAVRPLYSAPFLPLTFYIPSPCLHSRLASMRTARRLTLHRRWTSPRHPLGYSPPPPSIYRLRLSTPREPLVCLVCY